jgi:MoaA/NifB/PqqE/SkfB family radical SAM enzyme
MKKVDLVRKSFQLVNRGKASLPLSPDPIKDLEELHFELTYECNQRCVMCDIWNRYRLNPDLKKKELTFDEIRRFVENSEYLKTIKLIILSGGEPFLRDDIVDLCGYFLNRYPGLSLGILSNLFHTRLVTEKLSQIHSLYHPTNLWIGSSLDGIDGKHDEIRGIRGAFNGMMRTIESIRSCHPNVGICLNLTLTTRNYKELLPAFRLAKDGRMDFSAQVAVPWENAEKYHWDSKTLEYIEQTINVIAQEIVEDYTSRGMLNKITKTFDVGLLSKLYYWKGLVSYQKNPHRFFKRCVGGAKFAIFSPDGDLYFCPILKNRVAGNIRDYGYSFDDLWTTNAGNKIREFINEGICHCWLNCTIYPNAGEAIQYSQTLPKRGFQFFRRFLNKGIR